MALLGGGLHHGWAGYRLPHRACPSRVEDGYIGPDKTMNRFFPPGAEVDHGFGEVSWQPRRGDDHHSGVIAVDASTCDHGCTFEEGKRFGDCGIRFGHCGSDDFDGFGGAVSVAGGAEHLQAVGAGRLLVGDRDERSIRVLADV